MRPDLAVGPGRRKGLAGGEVEGGVSRLGVGLAGGLGGRTNPFGFRTRSGRAGGEETEDGEGVEEGLEEGEGGVGKEREGNTIGVVRFTGFSTGLYGRGTALLVFGLSSTTIAARGGEEGGELVGEIVTGAEGEGLGTATGIVEAGEGEGEERVETDEVGLVMVIAGLSFSFGSFPPNNRFVIPLESARNPSSLH